MILYCVNCNIWYIWYVNKSYNTMYFQRNGYSVVACGVFLHVLFTCLYGAVCRFKYQ